MLKLIRKLLGIGITGEELSQSTLGSIDVRKDEEYIDLWDWVTKEKVLRVWYLTANYKKGENCFDQYHLIDVGLTLELSNSKWLNWIWIEEGYNGDFEYNITTSDILGRFHTMFYRKEEVSSTEKWKELVGESITDVRFEFKEREGKTYLSKLKMIVADRQITISSIEEPENGQEIDVENLEFSTEWSIIAFDD